MQTNLAISTAFAAISGLVFFLVGRAVSRRQVSQEVRLARDAFVLFWHSLAAISVFGALINLTATSTGDFHLVLSVDLLIILVLCASLWGLLFYLVFLFTNSRRWAWPLGLGYLLYYGLLTYVILRNQPIGIHPVGPDDWNTQLDYLCGGTAATTDCVQKDPLYGAVFSFLIGPQILAALAYLTFYFRVDEPIQKRRVLIVSLSILGWWGSSIPAGFNPGLAHDTTWQIVSRLIGLAAAGLIYYAYTGLKPKEPRRSRIDAGDSPTAVDAAGQPEAPKLVPAGSAAKGGL